MDIACVRKVSSTELRERASTHTTECALMGHCIESGFALNDDDGRLHLLSASGHDRPDGRDHDQADGYGQLDVREECVGDPPAPKSGPSQRHGSPFGTSRPAVSRSILRSSASHCGG